MLYKINFVFKKIINLYIKTYIMKNNLSYILKIIFFVYLIIIMFLSFMPVENIGSSSDKINHIAAFIVFALLFKFSYSRRKIIFVFLSGLSFGIFIELVQYFLPYRSCDFFDVLADLCGLVIGYGMVVTLSIIKQR